MFGTGSSQAALLREDIPVYRNPECTIDQRVADLLARMTTAEKVAQMLCVWGLKRNVLFDETGRLDPDRLLTSYGDGIGQIARLSDTGGGLSPREMAETANAIQNVLAVKTRLGIPVIFHEECLHGLAAREATSYPQPIGLAGTFNPGLVREIYDAIAVDARSRGAHQALTPVLDVARDPRWGRVEETFGEDPYLVSRMGIAAVEGFQGGRTLKTKTHVAATLKHFAAHGQPEAGMNCGPANVSERELRDVFLFPFREVLRETGAASVMASYNEIDGIPSHANRWLLRDVLRKEWGFTGFVVSDYYAITELHRREEVLSHGVAGSKAEAAALAARAGVNIELPDPDCYPALAAMVEKGTIAETLIDELVAPLLRIKFQLGLFENPFVDPGRAGGDARTRREETLALRAARETITLLKNDNALLPIDAAKYRSIAVIGPNADRELLGGYSGTPRRSVSLLKGIQERAGAGVRVRYAEGCRITVGGSWNDDAVTLPDPAVERGLLEQAVEAARESDLIILALGGNEQTSREAWSRIHLGDRPDLGLIGLQNELVDAVAATGKPVAVLLFNGRPKSVGAVAARAGAVLECWYLGQESGRAAAEVLFGDYNPAGKLPISFPRSAGHIPCFYNHKPSARRGYLFDDATPLYPFGYGLSYTTFRFGNLRIADAAIRAGGSTSVSIDVTNTGSRAGEEVVQMYVRDLVSSATRPVRELKGFEKIMLQPGETRTVSLPIGPEHLSFTTAGMEYAVEPGDFEIMVGSSSREADLLKGLLRVA